MAQYLPNGTISDDKSLYPQMPVEKSPNFSTGKVLRLILIPILLMFFLNLGFYSYLKNDWLDRGQAIVRVKWQLLDEITTPVDYVVLGDSSINQGFDPTLVALCTNLTGVNLATIGIWGFVDDVWLLQNYIDQHGIPETVLVLHSFDVPQRSINLTAGLGTYQIPIDRIQNTPFAQDLSLGDWFTIYQLRLTPLFSRQTTLQNLRAAFTDRQFAILTPDYQFNDMGYQTWDEASILSVEKQFDETKTSILAGDWTDEFSEINLQAINILIDMADTYGFELYFGNGPIYETLEADPDFVPIRRELEATYRSLTSPHENVYYLPDVVTFPKTQMEGIDHIIMEAAPRYTLHMANAVWGIDSDANAMCNGIITPPPPAQ